MTVRVVTFSPDWGLPSAGPFAVKLLAWLELAGIPYEQVIEDDPRKGPKKKNPWIEVDGELIGDTEVIIDLLSQRHKVDMDDGLSPEQRAVGYAWRRAFEEHFHQVLEWELFVHPAGAAYMHQSMTSKLPPIVGPAVFAMLKSHFRKQLYARGIARHSPDVIAAKGRADIDALAAFLGDGPFLLRDRPSTTDTAVFGQLAPMVYWPMATPVAAHARSVEPIAAYCERMRKLCFDMTEKRLEPA
ncbi:MAG: glutathione S-transferase family protein [Hyphomicrobiales bacterium]